MNITRLAPVAITPESPHARFRRLRRDANLALLAWLREQPDAQDVADEVAGSIYTIQQLAVLARAGAV